MIQLAEADLATQARNTAAQAAKTIQTGTKGAAEKFNNFIENEGSDPSRGVSGAGSKVQPERQDFWDSFGEPASSKGGSSIGTAAMRKGGEKEEGWGTW